MRLTVAGSCVVVKAYWTNLDPFNFSFFLLRSAFNYFPFGLFSSKLAGCLIQTLIGDQGRCFFTKRRKLKSLVAIPLVYNS